MSRLLVRRPSPRLADGEVTHIGRTSVDPDLAQRQWEAYVDVFRTRGWEIIQIDAADEQPDGVFVEDAVVVFGDLAVLCRAGAESRRGEAPTVREAVAATGLEVADVGFHRSDQQWTCGRPVCGERIGERPDLDGVADRCSGAVCLDISDIVGAHAGPPQRCRDR